MVVDGVAFSLILRSYKSLNLPIPVNTSLNCVTKKNLSIHPAVVFEQLGFVPSSKLYTALKLDYFLKPIQVERPRSGSTTCESEFTCLSLAI